MKFYQQIYTSAPAGLWTSGQGYSTVACHEKIPPPVRRYTESLSYDVEACGGQPVFFFAHVENWVLFNRTCATRADHTGRSNYVAHTITAPRETITQWLSCLEHADKPIVSPAALILYWNQTKRWRDEWTEEEKPRFFSDADEIDCPEPETVSVVCDHKNNGWYRDPALGLSALDDDLNFKKLIWEKSSDPIELLTYFDQVFRAFDPALGVRSKRSHIENWFRLSAKECWEYSFATLLTKSQKPDDFLWYGIRDSLSTGAKSPRERFSTENPVVSPKHADQSEYLRDEKAAVLKDALGRYQIFKHKFRKDLYEARKQMSQKQGAAEKKFQDELEMAENLLADLAHLTTIIKSLIDNSDPLRDALRCVDSARKFSTTFSAPNVSYYAPAIAGEEEYNQWLRYLQYEKQDGNEERELSSALKELKNSVGQNEHLRKLDNDAREKKGEIVRRSSELESLLKRMGRGDSRGASLPLPKPDNFSGNRRTRKEESKAKDLFAQGGEPSGFAWLKSIRIVCELLLLTVAGLFGYLLLNQNDSITKKGTENAEIQQVNRSQGDKISELKGENSQLKDELEKARKARLEIKTLGQPPQETKAAPNKSPNKETKPKESVPKPSATGAPANDVKAKNTTK
jgi:hypothetical protein